MLHNVTAPSVGESISEVSILKWAKNDGDQVKAGDLLLEIESDKATVEIVAEASGRLSVIKPAGERIAVGTVIGNIDDTAKGNASAPKPSSGASAASGATAAAAPKMVAQPQTASAAEVPLSPAVRKAVTEQGIDPNTIAGTGKNGRILKGDVAEHVARGVTPAPMGAPSTQPTTRPVPTAQDRPGDRRVPMSMIRTRIAERLVQAQHTAAILTTFNEVDLSAVIATRNEKKEAFKAKHGVALSFMSFFSLATIEALKQIPEVNASIDGRDIVYHDYVDLGIAVSSERGLVVPVIRNAHQMSMLQIEKGIAELAVKARENKLSIADMTGGTFTISNGGTFGSLLSTPILNYPQTGILGMHKIQERPMVVNGKIEARPMMYLALSYDHRLIDGKGAVTFLVAIKECLENPKEKLKLEF